MSLNGIESIDSIESGWYDIISIDLGSWKAINLNLKPTMTKRMNNCILLKTHLEYLNEAQILQSFIFVNSTLWIEVSKILIGWIAGMHYYNHHPNQCFIQQIGITFWMPKVDSDENEDDPISKQNGW